MKNFTFTLALLLICTVNFAQTPVCPTYFRRNNGNGQCPDGSLKVYFTTCPSYTPILDSVYVGGVKINVTFGPPNLNFCNSQNYISYCIIGTNISPVTTWQMFFHANGTAINYVCSTSEGNTLPVSYLSFDAVVNNKAVLLKWLTAQETNNSHFEVERSFDNNNFSTIGLVLDGYAVNGTGKSYQYKDNSSELTGRSIVYYRLKQIDIDGKATISKVIAVRLQAKADAIMQVSPNPFVENLNARFTATETGIAQIRITNLAGQTMLSKQSTISKGYNNINIENLTGLASGMYVAQLIMNGVVIDNQRVIKN